MKVSDIRPDDLAEENLRLYARDLGRMLKHRADFVDVPCPACSSPLWRPYFSKDGFEYCCCTDCGTVYIDPRPTRDMLMDWYSNAPSIRHWNERIFPATEASRRERIFKPRAAAVVDVCRRVGVRTGSLLDAGAGFGTFCEELAALNVFERVLALEPSTELARTCIGKGLNTIEMPIECLDMRGLDVITAWELVEHLYRPKDFVDVCARSLRPGGLLILTTPNIKGFDLSILGVNAANVGGPNHLNYFNPSSIFGLLYRAGFAVLELTTPGELDAEIVRRKVLDGELDLSLRPFLKSVLIDNWEAAGAAFQKFLKENGLSSNMMVVARLLYNP